MKKVFLSVLTFVFLSNFLFGNRSNIVIQNLDSVQCDVDTSHKSKSPDIYWEFIKRDSTGKKILNMPTEEVFNSKIYLVKN